MRAFDAGHDSYIAQHRKKKLANLAKENRQPSKKLVARNSQIRTIADSSTMNAEAKPQFAWID